MNFDLTDEQRAVADMATALFGDHCTDDHLRAFDQSGAPFMADLWKGCVETGLHALALPESAGGSGLGATDLMVVLEAQGKALAQVPLWRHQLAAAALATFGGEAVAPLASAAAEGADLLTLSLDGLSGPHGVELAARRTEGGWLLNGSVPAVPLGAQSRAALVVAALSAGNRSEGVRLVLVDLDAAGVERIPGIMTNGEAVADLRLGSVPIAEGHVLPEAAVPWLLERSIAAVASLQLGVSAEQLRRTVDYVAERRQFDRAIGTFQAVQMSMADAHIAIEALRSVLWQLCYRIDAGLPSPSEALAVKYLACETGHLVGHKAQHVHGGIGVDLTYPIHRFLYWSRALGITLGGAQASLETLGNWLADNDKLGWKYDLEENHAL